MVVVVFCLFQNLAAQQCGTEFLHNELQLSSETNSRFGEGTVRIDDRIRSVEGPHVIPIVFHIFHLGEPVGIGSNVSDAFIQESMDRLNKNMSGENGNGLDMEVRFCLASQNPDGHSTDGINRVNGSRIPGYASYGARFGNSNGASLKTIKSYSKWPVQDYYNVWVVHSIGEGTILGLASYPTGDELDGAVLRYSTLNTDVLTHEIGHGFNLFHTFQGDSGELCPKNADCSQHGDEVCDTPPHRRFDCYDTSCNSTGDLEQATSNFMSYCVGRNSFTQGQKDRFLKVLFGPIRSSLLNSSGCSNIIDYNIGLIDIISHQNQFCGGRYFPKIRVRNQGAVTLNSFIVKYKVAGQTERTQVLLTNLAYGQYGVFDLNPINVSDENLSVSVSLHSPNTFKDEQSQDNSMTSRFAFDPVEFIDPEIEENFQGLNYSLPEAWSKEASDSQISKWNAFENINNGWLYINGNFTQPNGIIKDDLTMPGMDLSDSKNIKLNFDYAFGGNQQAVYDQTYFEVLVQSGCNGHTKTLWKSAGDELITFNSGSLNNLSNYKTMSLSLDEFAGEQVFVSFRYGYNTAGSPGLNLDNVQISAQSNDTEIDDTINEENLPDLTLSELRDFETDIEPGNAFNFYFNINNIGTADVTTSYSIESYLSKDQKLSASDIAMERSFTGFTKVGSVPDLLGRVQLPSIILGDFYLILKIDGEDKVEESNELNNILVSNIPIKIGAIQDPPEGSKCEQNLDGFDFMGTFNDAAYYLSSYKTHWSNASFQALQNGGQLLSINDRSENNFIQNNINEIILIGLHDQYNEGSFLWHSGESADYLNLESANTPANDFGRMNFWNGKWALDSKWVERKFVIEIPCAENSLPDNISLRQSPSQEKQSDLTIYPNPTTSVLNLELYNTLPHNEVAKIEVLNTSGFSVYRAKKQMSHGQNKLLINTSNLKSGVYQLIVDLSNRDRFIKRFVKI